jgi:tRNA-dihydrouridine synthase B
MRKNFTGTLSVKMRTGWDAKSIVAPEFARIAVTEGAELISVHGRTRSQQYTGRADRSIIRRVVEAAPEVPVLANGDIVTPTDVFEMLADTGAAGVMIGRGAMGNPWIFEQTLSLARGGGACGPTRAERLATIEKHIGWMQRISTDPGTLAINLKKYVSAYSRGLSGAAKFRQQALESSGVDEILELTRGYFAVVKRTPALRDEERAA